MKKNPLIERGTQPWHVRSCRHMSFACPALYPYPTPAQIEEARAFYEQERLLAEAQDYAEQARMG